MFTLFKFVSGGTSEPFKEVDAKTSDSLGFFAEAKVVSFKSGVIETVKQKISQIRYDSFCTFGL